MRTEPRKRERRVLRQVSRPHLTQVTTIGSVAGCGRLPGQPGGFPSVFQIREGLPGVSVPFAVAGRFPLPTLRTLESVAASLGIVAVCPLCLPSLVDSGEDFPGHAYPAEGWVSSHQVGDQPEERRQCSGPATRLGAGELPDSLVLAAQTAAGDGQAGRDRLSGKIEVAETYWGAPGEGVGSGNREEGADLGGGARAGTRHRTHSDATHQVSSQSRVFGLLSGLNSLSVSTAEHRAVGGSSSPALSNRQWPWDQALTGRLSARRRPIDSETTTYCSYLSQWIPPYSVKKVNLNPARKRLPR